MQKPLIRLVHGAGPTTANHSLGGTQASLRAEAGGALSTTSQGQNQQQLQ